VTSFSERHAPAPRPLGPEIPLGVRRAIDSWFNERDVDPQEIRRRWFQRQGYGDVVDVEADVRDRWGAETAATLHRDLEADPLVAQAYVGDVLRNSATLIVYRHVPAPLYLDYVELAVEKYAGDRAIVQEEYVDYIDDPTVAPLEYLNGLLAARRIDYRFNEQGRAEWHGDEGAYFETIHPALDALKDLRLDGCRQEFEAALGHLRSGTAKDREDAIEETGKAVESAMKVTLDSHGIGRAGNETPEPLWNLLRENAVVPPKTKDAILSASRLRNEYGGHGQGGEVREIPEGIPELAARAAAAAISYLAGRLV